MALGSKPRIWRPASSADADEAAWVQMTKSRCSGPRDLMNSKEKLSMFRQWMCISENRTGWLLRTLAFNKKKIRRQIATGLYQLWSPASVHGQGAVNSAVLGPCSPWQWLLFVPPSELISPSEIVLPFHEKCSMFTEDPISQASSWESENPIGLFSFSIPSFLAQAGCTFPSIVFFKILCTSYENYLNSFHPLKTKSIHNSSGEAALPWATCEMIEWLNSAKSDWGKFASGSHFYCS